MLCIPLQILNSISLFSFSSRMDDYDYDIESVKAPEEEEDPDDARDARIDYEMDRDR